MKMATLSCDNTNVVFIDTNLDTHLALNVSDHDTVSDLKKRILSEHPLCFANIGQIQIHGIKVKRKGYLYHLSDSMFVKSAFVGFNKSWFLSVDVSALGECGKNEQLFLLSSPPNQVACVGVANGDLIGPGDNAISFPSKSVSGVDDFKLLQLEDKRDEGEEVPVVSPCVSEHIGNEVVNNLDTGVKSSANKDAEIQLPGSIAYMEDHCHVNHELPSSHVECEADGSVKGIKDDRNVCEENPSISVPSTKKKRKSKRKKEDMVQGDNLKDNTGSVDNPLSGPSERASIFNNFQAPQLENKHDEKEEIPSVGPCVSEHAGKDIVKKLEMGVNSSTNNDPSIPFPSSIPETRDSANHELPNSHIECEVDGSNKGIKDDGISYEEGTSKPVRSEKKKRKSKRKKEDTVQDGTSKENDASVVGPDNDTVQQDIVFLANPSGNADKEVIKETEVLKECQHIECDNNNTTNDIDVVSMKEASEPGPATNKKHKKRKRSLTRDSKEMLKVETASQKDEAQKSDEAHEGSKESKDQSVLHHDKSSDDVEYRHNKVTEDSLDTKPSAKKKQKGKQKGGEKSLSNTKLINDFNVDNTSHPPLEDQQNIQNRSADQSAEHFNDADPLRTSTPGRRRKGKINSSNLHETPAVISSRKDEETDHSSIQKGVQEDISKDCPLSKDIIVDKTTLDNMEIGTDACKENIQSTVKRTGNHENHCDIEMVVQPSDVNEPQELTEDNENFVIVHRHKSEGGQAEGAEEGREVSSQNDPKLMLVEKCTPSHQDNTNANNRELNVTSKVMDVNGMNEPVKSEKKNKGTRKDKNSDGGLMLIEGNAETEEDPLNQTEGKKISPEEMQGTVLSVTYKEDDFSMDNAGSLDQIKSKSIDEHVDKRQRKKSNNKQASTSKSIPNIPTKDQVPDSKEEHDVHRIHPDEKVSDIHKTGQDAKLSSRSDSAMSSIEENRKTRNNAARKNMDLEKQRKRVPKSNSKLEASYKMVRNKAGKASGNNAGGAVRITRQKKSLLAGAIFKDDDSGTSENEDKVDNSDASIRTLSDNSLLSDFSDGDSGAVLDSQQNGSSGGKRRQENGGRSSLKASLSDTKGMPIDRVLRSSSRYKKAKITASQETESQQEFVPDSLADM